MDALQTPLLCSGAHAAASSAPLPPLAPPRRPLPGCGHTFHAACVDAWLETKPLCPVCRANVAPPEGDVSTAASAAAAEEAAAGAEEAAAAGAADGPHAGTVEAAQATTAAAGGMQAAAASADAASTSAAAQQAERPE